jgi:hypothetical protein
MADCDSFGKSKSGADLAPDSEQVRTAAYDGPF